MLQNWLERSKINNPSTSSTTAVSRPSSSGGGAGTGTYNGTVGGHMLLVEVHTLVQVEL
jgi:uncharacterized membrane protein